MELFFENQQSGNGGVIVMRDSTEEVGRLTYTIMPEQNFLVVSYVLVHPKFGGQGMGKKLVDESVRFARNNQWQLKAHCSYAHSVLLRREDVGDIFKA